MTRYQLHHGRKTSLETEASFTSYFLGAFTPAILERKGRNSRAHFTVTFFFAAKGAMYHVAIATVIFSHVKITCYFHM